MMQGSEVGPVLGLRASVTGGQGGGQEGWLRNVQALVLSECGLERAEKDRFGTDCGFYPVLALVSEL